MSVMSEQLPAPVVQVRKCTPESRLQAMRRHRHHENRQTVPTETLAERLIGTGRMIINLAHEGIDVVREWYQEKVATRPLAEVYDLQTERERRIGITALNSEPNYDIIHAVTED